MASNREQIKETWYKATVEFDSATKKNEITSFSGKWRELEIIVREIS